MINYFKLFSLPNYSVDQIIWFSTEYQIMIFGYKPNINYLPNIIWLNRISTIRLQPWLKPIQIVRVIIPCRRTQIHFNELPVFGETALGP